MNSRYKSPPRKPQRHPFVHFAEFVLARFPRRFKAFHSRPTISTRKLVLCATNITKFTNFTKIHQINVFLWKRNIKQYVDYVNGVVFQCFTTHKTFIQKRLNVQL